ncbi:MAG: AAA family ATPase [Campylobacterota bacterium]|nr:AAA family ATPase [Campylobacterota bacterium]
MLEKLKNYEQKLLSNFGITYRRYLYNKLNEEDRMVAIVGARGIGKTTTLLQRTKELKEKHGESKVLYFTFDYPFLINSDFFELVGEFVEAGIEFLIVDEVHKYNDFAIHLKAIYDIYPTLKVLFTSSSAISLLNSQADLSRRVTVHHLKGLSFREYLEITLAREIHRYDMRDIVTNHIEISKDLSKDIEIQKEFAEYLKRGYYPFYFDKRESFFQTLFSTINLTLDIDLVNLKLIEQRYTYKLKKLIEVVCESNPFEVNMTKIASLSEISRVKLYDYLDFLEKGELLNLIEENTQGLKKISKPSKIYLANTNLLYTYCENAKIGTIRETFFVNQIKGNLTIKSLKAGDFIVDNRYTFEVGGKNKSFNQIKDMPDSYVVADDIIVGKGNKIPLWVFGFLY